ncbi:hypothetical protein [Leeuwenhoekiella marinoflava]|uniref:M61 family metallopeptidase n=1 Tax=Leeuwenhoekiella marinoflava TaxID=988 RepID=UPI003001F537
MIQKINLFLIILIFNALNPVAAQKESEIQYQLNFSEAQEHYIAVSLKLSNLKESTTTLVLPVWTPGYYKILDNPAHIVDFQAITADSVKLDWHKSSKNKWVINTNKQTSIRVSYRVYANRKSVAESNVNATYAFLANTDIFMFPEGKKEDSISLAVELPEQWSEIATGLKKQEDELFYASNFDVLYDSPLYLGNQKMFDFQQLGKDFTLAIATPEGFNKDRFIKDLREIILRTTDLMQHIPFEEYTFIMMEAGGGGLEHANSQAVFTYGSFDFKTDADYKAFLNFITHEYFHLYNVKALRPVELGPFDYSKENYTTMLWVAEGFTVYYEYLIMRDAGLINSQEVLHYLSSHFKAIENKEGKEHMSLERSSFDVWNHFLNKDAITDATTISYYQKGPIIALLLDLAIRHESENKHSLDDVMRYLYKVYYQEQEQGYTEDEFWQAVAELAGKSLDELRGYVETTTAPDYEKYLAYGALALDLTEVDNPETTLVEREYQLIKTEPKTSLQKEIREALLRE